jgi:predicted RNA binding protein YcfA (HicA-like mRNA interferase family)
MKIPRDLSGIDLIKLLKNYEYRVTRQTGSHIRLTTQQHGEHHLTIPNHDPIKIGTLSAIISEVAAHFNKDKADIMNDLFG